MTVGEQKFYEYIRRFGFGERTGIELPGEIPGIIRPPRAWSKISITRIPMGHEVGVTPLQMTVAMATIANGGKLITPRIVKSITSEEGKTVSSFLTRRVAPGHFAGNRGANRQRAARRGERSRHRGGSGGPRLHDLRQNRHRPKGRSQRRVRAWEISRLVLRLFAGGESGIRRPGCAG